MKRSLFATVFVLLASAAFAQADAGDPKLKSIDALGFGPDGLLLIGDSKSAAVVTVDTGDVRETTWNKAGIANIDQLLAAKLGLTAKDIQITKVVVNPASRKAYIAIRSMKIKQDVILTIDGAGKVAEFSLENVKFNRYPLNTGDKGLKVLTGIAWAGDRILVASQVNTTFESRVFSIVPGAKGDPCSSFSTETFHTGHNAVETKAPLRTIMSYEDAGKRFVIGSFTCTPIVRYPLTDVQPGAQLKGSSVVELGHGNAPREMFVYEKDGKKYILMGCLRMARFHKTNPVGPSPYWACKVDHDLLKETTKVNKNALWRFNPRTGKASKSETDRATIAQEFFGVQYMDRLDSARALTIREEKGGLALRVLQLP
ncbi:MAG: hypothetical protein HYX68_12510 [Planctomycetes bacterium]|nr:hypothetical protein [Planctomycetota bacterium]